MIDHEILYIGWDVGGWNCDRNQKSRDALAILDSEGKPFGKPWRGNLRGTINTANTAHEFLTGVIVLCEPGCSDMPDRAILAIDAPLGFPEAFIRMVTGGSHLKEVWDSSANNQYLYRFTERQLADDGITPLSSIKDMIGSQTTKAMHVVSKFTPKNTSKGVWTDDKCLTVIETYPSLCRARLGKERPVSNSGSKADIDDARICARVARVFDQDNDCLVSPTPDTPCSEGWIWAPRGKPPKKP